MVGQTVWFLLSGYNILGHWVPGNALRKTYVSLLATVVYCIDTHFVYSSKIIGKHSTGDLRLFTKGNNLLFSQHVAEISFV